MNLFDEYKDYQEEDMMTEEEYKEYCKLSSEEKIIKRGEYIKRWFKKYPHIKDRFEDSGRSILESMLYKNT